MKDVMSTTPFESITEDKPIRQKDLATVCIYGLSLMSAGLFLFLPLVNLLSPSPWQRYMGAIHGCASLFAVVVIAYAGHMAFPLLRGNKSVLPQMRTLCFWASFLSFLANRFGKLGIHALPSACERC